MEWVSLIVTVLSGAVLIGGGAAARGASKSGAILIILAGVFELLSGCCVLGVDMAASEGGAGVDPIRISQGLILGTTCVDVVVVVLILIGLVSIAKAVSQPSA